MILLLLFSAAEPKRLDCKNICTCKTIEAISNEPHSCCSFQNATCYSNFEEISVDADTLIVTCVDNIELSTEVRIKNVTNVLISGYSSAKSNITCRENAGFLINNSKDIEIRNMRFIDCGALRDSTSENADEKRPFKFTTSLHISNSVNVTIENIDIEQGNGTGMVMLNSYGAIAGCTFKQNRVVNAQLPGGGGLYVEFNSKMPTNSDDGNQILKIHGSTFSDNAATSLIGRKGTYVGCNTVNSFQGFGRGGGITIFLLGDTSNVTVEIEHVNLTSNRAIWGGGMYVHFCNFASENQVLIKNVFFILNTCEHYGGGGIDFGITPHRNINFATRNQLLFTNCTFESNRALFGGGVSLYSAETETDLENSVSFEGCTWKYNTAYYGSALDIAPQLIKTPHNGYLPQIKLKDVTFEDNIITRQQRNRTRNEALNDTEPLTQKKRIGSGSGAFLVAGMKINFEGKVNFRRNNGSAIYAVSTILEFGAKTEANFDSNRGLNGGAMALHGFSALWMHNNTSVTMTNNSAALGGAIYHRSIDKHDYLFSHNCFIQSVSRTSSEQEARNREVNFKM